MISEEEHPLTKMHQWIEKEKTLSSFNPNRVVLATASRHGIPHSRVVAIREITSKGIIFFTQKGTQKVIDLIQNPHASMTLWLASQQRQVVLDGIIELLTYKENLHFWETIPREQQLRFSTYAPTSTQPISSSSILEDRFKDLEKKFTNTNIPMSDHYCGFQLIAQTISFYTLGFNTFSEVLQYKHDQERWSCQLMCP